MVPLHVLRFLEVASCLASLLQFHMRNARSGRNPRRWDLFFNDAGLGSKEFHSKHSLEQSHVIDRMTHKKKQKNDCKRKKQYSNKKSQDASRATSFTKYKTVFKTAFFIPTFSDVL